MDCVSFTILSIASLVAFFGFAQTARSDELSGPERCALAPVSDCLSQRLPEAAREIAPVKTRLIEGSVRIIFYGTSREDIASAPAGEIRYGENLERYGKIRRQNGVRYGSVEVHWSPNEDRAIGSPSVGKPRHVQNLPTLLQLADQNAKHSPKLISSIFEQRLLYFIHGVNNTFNSAGLAAFRMARGASYPHPVFFFSWPASEWKVGTNYLPDIGELEYARPYINESIIELSQRSSARRGLDIIAHSAGSLGVARALAEPHFRDAQEPRLATLVFAASDLDQRLFIRDISQTQFSELGTTVYVNPIDAALEASSSYWGWRTPRLGNSLHSYGKIVDTVHVRGRFHTIDRHQYVHLSRAVLKDLNGLLVDRRRASERLGSRPQSGIWLLEVGEEIDEREKRNSFVRRADLRQWITEWARKTLLPRKE